VTYWKTAESSQLKFELSTFQTQIKGADLDTYISRRKITATTTTTTTASAAAAATATTTIIIIIIIILHAKYRLCADDVQMYHGINNVHCYILPLYDIDAVKN
jgi:hypothetical protein